MKLMSKLSTKIAIALVSFIGVALFFGGGKAFAFNCPSGSSVDPDWGIQLGGLEHNFASVAVYAHNDKDGLPLNVNYQLNSSADHDHGQTYSRPPDVPKALYPDARIFKVHVDSSGIEADARYKQRWFSTGETLYSPAQSCKGWDELGPGTSTFVGNGFVLDCQEKDTGGTLWNNHFWIDKISTPSGDAGRYGGHWAIKVSTGGAALHGNPPYYPMSYSDDFEVTNGENARVNLTWYPNNHTPGSVQTFCNYLKVITSSTERAYVHVEDSGGHVLVQGSGSYWSLVGAGSTKDWNYKAMGIQVETHVIKKSQDASGAWTVVDSDNDNTYTCYDAKCDINVQGDVSGKDKGVESGSTDWSIDMHVHNNAGDPGNPYPNATELYGAIEPDGSKPLILASNSGDAVGFWFAPLQIDKQENAYKTWDANDGLREPGNPIANYALGARLYYDLNSNDTYDSSDLLIANCTPDSYDVYKHFDLNVSASINMIPSVEDPNSVTFNGRADGNVPDYPGGIDVNYDVNSERTPYGGATQSLDSRTNSTGHTALVYNYPYTPSSNNAGDKYFFDNLSGDPLCQFYVYQAHGWVGPSNQFSDDTYGDCGSAGPQYVYDRPYLHAYGADVTSGSKFKNGDTCDSTGNSQNISAFRSTSATKGGSGAQFAALALGQLGGPTGQISGFGTASVRSTSPSWPTGLSFANSGVTIDNGPPGEDQPNDGGFYQGQAMCAQDFYDTQDSPNTYNTNSVNINTSGQIQDNKQTLFDVGGGTLNITSNNTDFTKRATIFVNGDVVIKKNISYQPGKYLAIIAKGNIYIKNTVTRLDGLYVAQPSSSSSGGIIYTCASGTNDISLNSRYTSCNSQLVINGAFVAKYVKFHRAAHSLRNSTSGEVPDFSNGSGTKAAEIFNFSPEMYLYTPIYNGLTTEQPYQYITTLPPVL